MNKLNILQCVPQLLRTKHCTSLPLVISKYDRYHTNVMTEQLYKNLLLRFKTKDFTCQPYITTISPLRPMSSFSDKIRDFWKSKLTRYKAAALGCRLYKSTIDNLNYVQFYKEFNMADTFFSWFLITELHVWMLMCRVMAEGKNGKVIRHTIVDCMWEDVTTRTNLMGDINATIKKKQLRDLSEQFYAALIEYDEGIMSDDKALAGAVWRIFFNLECNNPEHLETLVLYIRKQINALDKLSLDEIRSVSRIEFPNLEPSI